MVTQNLFGTWALHEPTAGNNRCLILSARPDHHARHLIATVSATGDINWHRVPAHELRILNSDQARLHGMVNGITSLFGTKVTCRDTHITAHRASDVRVVSDMPSKHGRVMILWTNADNARTHGAFVSVNDLDFCC